MTSNSGKGVSKFRAVCLTRPEYTVEPLNEKNRLFTTLDLFPSTLAAMGCEIEGNRLGLGVNLFSDEKTLAEKYGYDYMFDEMGKMSKFYVKELLYPEKK